MNCNTTKTQPKTLEELDREILHNNKIIFEMIEIIMQLQKVKKNSLEYKKLQKKQDKLTEQLK